MTTHKTTVSTIKCFVAILFFSIFTSSLLRLSHRWIFYHVLAKEMAHFMPETLFHSKRGGRPGSGWIWMTGENELTRVHSRERQTRASAARLRRRPAPVSASRWDLRDNEMLTFNIRYSLQNGLRQRHHVQDKTYKKRRKKHSRRFGWLTSSRHHNDT